MYGIDRKQIIMIFILSGAIIFGAGYKLSQFKKEPVVTPVLSESQISNGAKKQKDEAPKKVSVYICGAVRKPGVYTFDEGARIAEGIKVAEALNDAELVSVNLAEVMTDGQQIYVPRKGEEGVEVSLPKISVGDSQKTSQAGVSQNSSLGAGKININTAGRDELDKLTGIGPSTAEKIIEYRTTHGKFKNISELMNVPGIGEKKLAKFKDKIKV